MVYSIEPNNLSGCYENFTCCYENFTRCLIVHYNLSIWLQFLHLVEAVKEQREHAQAWKHGQSPGSIERQIASVY
jgi:hypothetical protein